MLAPPDRERLLQRAHGGMLTGLALSGGGVRSATFSLGALQALARCGLLRHIDYLSTVSGGGFVGAIDSYAYRLPVALYGPMPNDTDATDGSSVETTHLAPTSENENENE